eukprot:3140601-Rhodomonas_salina.4
MRCVDLTLVKCCQALACIGSLFQQYKVRALPSEDTAKSNANPATTRCRTGRAGLLVCGGCSRRQSAIRCAVCEPRFWYWELLEMKRKLLLASVIPVLIGKDNQVSHPRPIPEP